MRLSFVICLILVMFNDVLAFEGPECDREEIENYWSNPAYAIFESIEEHIAEALVAESEYEGYPDLACFTELYLSIDISSDRDIHRRAEKLLDLEGEHIFQKLVLAADQANEFFFQAYFKNVLCVAQQLADMVPDLNHCSENMLFAVNAIKKEQTNRVHKGRQTTESNESTTIQDQKDDSTVLMGDQSGSEQIWCLLTTGVYLYSKDICVNRRGEYFLKKTAADKEYRKIKALQEKEKTELAKVPLAEEEKHETVVEEETQAGEQRESGEKQQQENQDEEGKLTKQKKNDKEKDEEDIQIYRPLFKVASESDESFCYEAWGDETRWYDGDATKQVSLDHCWDFTSIDGKRWVGMQLGERRLTEMKSTYGLFHVTANLLWGDRDACYIIARASRAGRGVEKDTDKALKYYIKAAEKGHSKAQYYVGLYHAEGYGIPKDYVKAIEWLELAVANNDPDAQAYLGYLNEYGLGVGKNLTRAKTLYRKAATHGQSFAQERLSR